MKKLPADQLHDPHAAVYAAVLLLDENQTDAAKEYIEIARHGPIFVEEKKMLDEVVAKLAVTTPSPAASPNGTGTSPAPTGTPTPTSTR
jgi:hypothetical protein